MAGTVLTLACVAFIGLFWGTAATAVRTWYGTSTYNHGFLILPIVGYLIWIRRQVLATTVPAANFWGLVAIALLALLWLVGDIMAAVVVQQFALVAMLQALFLTVLGWRVVRHMIFPLFYLFFAVPFGEFLVPPLQDLTTHFVVLGLQVFGIPVFSDGIFISIPTGNFKVAEACAGLRFLIATMALSFLVANMFYRSWWRRISFVGLGMVVPIIANGFRALGIVMIAYLSDMTLAVGVDHIFYGWLFFALVTIILLAIGMTFAEKYKEDPAAEPGAGAVRAMANPNLRRSLGSLVAAGVIAVLVASGGPAWARYTDIHPDTVVAGLPMPDVRAPWTRAAGTRTTWHPKFPTADAEALRSYTDGKRTVDLYIAYYRYQRQAAEVVHWENAVADGKRWSRAGSGQSEAVIEGSPTTVVYTRMLAGSGARLAWHWYWVDGQYTANPYVAKLLQARARILGGPAAAAAIVVSTTYDETPAEAQLVLRDFLKHLKPLTPLLASVSAH